MAGTACTATSPNGGWLKPTHSLSQAPDDQAAATFVEDGIDTFVFRDGQIQVQTVRYTVQHKG